ncbi:MAG TPA: uroporphyrinogen decarboxylase family protein [Thermoguttaceae bacterium]|nr:uroporphyrinogen decarboxylase family protein [Thermoguttaceae bacterium]
MTSRDLVIRALNHEPVDRIPRDLWVCSAVENSRRDEAAELATRFPNDIVRPDFQYPSGKRSKGKPSRKGTHTDAWGCTWNVAADGAPGTLEASPLATVAEIAQYEPPWELLKGINLATVNRNCAETSRFVLASTETRPFERLQYLRGPQAALADLRGGRKRVRSMLAMLHEFFCKEMELWADSDVDGVIFRDNWGSQKGLLIAPEIWRDLFKPLYRDYCEILQAKDKFAFFHSDGDISDIFGDLVKMGVDAIHSQLFAMKIERLAKRFRGRVTFWGEIDSHQTLPQGTVEEVREAVLRVRKALDFGSGGLIAQCEWGADVPMQNLVAAFEQWAQQLPMHAN